MCGGGGGIQGDELLSMYEEHHVYIHDAVSYFFLWFAQARMFFSFRSIEGWKTRTNMGGDVGLNIST